MLATKRPRQERAEQEVGRNGLDSMISHVRLCRVEGLTIHVRNTNRRVGLFTKEDAHDAVEREVEEGRLQVHLQAYKWYLLGV